MITSARQAGDGLAEPRVGYVLKVFPRLSQTFILTEVLALERAGLDLTLFSLRRPKAEPKHVTFSRVRSAIHPVPREHPGTFELREAVLERAASMGREGGAEFDEAKREPPEIVAQALWLADAVDRIGLTHLHAHFATSAAATARLAARWSGVSFSFTAHARDIFHQSVCVAALGRRLADAAFTVTVSDFNARHLRAIYGDVAARVEVVRNGLDLLQMPYSPPEVRDRRIVAVGRLVEKKGFDDLLDACRILADRGHSFRCEIIGEGPMGAALRTKVVRSHSSALFAKNRYSSVSPVLQCWSFLAGLPRTVTGMACQPFCWRRWPSGRLASRCLSPGFPRS